MSDSAFRGIYPIAPATFTNAGALDYDSYRRAVGALLEAGCAGVTLFGIAGEYYKLSYEEEAQLIPATVEACRARGKQCIISNTRHSTEVAVAWARKIEEAGADAMMVLPPFFLKPGAAALCEHMVEVARAVSIPVMIQYAPEQTGVAIDPAALARLREDAPNITMYKIECKPPGRYISRLLELTGGQIDVFIGNAGFQMIEGFDRGAVGVMPGPSMFDIYVQIFDHYHSGRRDDARALHDVLVSMLNHIRQNVEMIIRFEKMILHRRGLIASDYCRRPSFEVDTVSQRVFDELYATLSAQFSS